VRSALVWLGVTDPVATMERSKAEDRDRITLRQMLTAWQGAFASVAVTAGEAIQAVIAGGILPGSLGLPTLAAAHLEALKAALELVALNHRHELDARRLGEYLRRNRERRADGRRFIYSLDTHAKVNRWVVV
jgi:hypothetical protein